ncbi:COG1361 S-layer family protein [Methanoregula sp.]|uniref:COG1361 S-layer family protein n=1 Tax=Methanoregula sp. TaxID=2052170 RepID=UPI003C7650C6
MANIGRLTCIILIFCACMIVPSMAGSQFSSGSPELSAYISGTNEFSPGDDVQLPVVIENTGLNEFVYSQPGIINRDDLPNTAKFLTVTLLPGDAPVIVKSDSQMLGDLDGGSTTNAVFTTKIEPDAAGGTYLVPVILNYTFLYSTNQYGVDLVTNEYKTENITLNIPIKIKSVVSIDVLSAIPEDLNVGNEGYIDMQIRNTGSENGTKSIVKILQSSTSPILPTDSSVYIGDFPPGSTATCRYRVFVSGDAQPQTYPVDVVVIYQNDEGDFVTSRTDTVGIPVGGKIDFSIISPPAIMNPGNTRVINVEYKNTGNTTAYSAHARITPEDPFITTNNDDTAYLGDLQPGESRTVSYTMSVDPGATLKEYGLDSQIQYKDGLENAYTSDTIQVKIDVNKPAGINAIVTNPIYLVIVIAAIIGIVYMIVQHRKKNK